MEVVHEINEINLVDLRLFSDRALDEVVTNHKVKSTMLNEIGNILLEAECEAILLQFHVSYTPRKRNLEADALSIPSYP